MLRWHKTCRRIGLDRFSARWAGATHHRALFSSVENGGLPLATKCSIFSRVKMKARPSYGIDAPLVGTAIVLIIAAGAAAAVLLPYSSNSILRSVGDVTRSLLPTGAARHRGCETPYSKVLATMWRSGKRMPGALPLKTALLIMCFPTYVSTISRMKKGGPRPAGRSPGYLNREVLP